MKPRCFKKKKDYKINSSELKMLVERKNNKNLTEWEEDRREKQGL